MLVGLFSAEGQAGLLPGCNSTAEIVHVFKAVFFQNAARTVGAVTGPAVGDHRTILVLVEFSDPLRQLLDGDMYCFRDMAAAVLAVVANVQENGIFTVAELGCPDRVHGFHSTQAAADFAGQQCAERADKRQYQYRVVTDEFENTCKIHAGFPLSVQRSLLSAQAVHGAEYFPHHADQAQGAGIADSVIDPVGILA